MITPWFECELVDGDFRLIIHHAEGRMMCEAIQVSCIGEALVKLADIYGYDLDTLKVRHQ